ncbi:hypothetical protein HBI56_079970 [Parastagonospora nodorum]|nr:hypothetical protein HBH75_139640 [Parastagonospora nodorum]KAH4947046.1 hypothetical protein HBH74_043200 [Parastagonospora nodorum]KAH4985819.1 hypothetical protein HBI76_116400 [Parastagonospora nodorum]KAH5159312.1 hypothetical protein HBI73_055680 [Parastagonospora nodorum]KAH5193899.1 hypothetical protein HBH68_139580 [Parastagonospora nodorum]
MKPPKWKLRADGNATSVIVDKGIKENSRRARLTRASKKRFVQHFNFGATKFFRTTSASIASAAAPIRGNPKIAAKQTTGIVYNSISPMSRMTHAICARFAASFSSAIWLR